MDLSKAFDTINHNLAKFHAYCFDKLSLLFISSYPENRLHRTKINI